MLHNGPGESIYGAANLSISCSIELALFNTYARRSVLERLNQWLTLTANFGVIAGIVFLAFEIQQNSEAIKAQTYQSRTEGAQELSAAIMDSEHFAPLLAKLGDSLFPNDPAVFAELNPDDRIRLMAHFQWLRVALDNQIYQYEHGFLEEGFYEVSTKPALQFITPALEELNLINASSPAFLKAIEPYRSDKD